MMTMKISQYLALGLLGVTLLSSCSKDKKNLEQKNNLKPTGKTEVLRATVNVEPLELEGNLRASLKSTGYDVPSLEVTKQELTNGTTKAHWGIKGNGYKHLTVNTSDIISANPKADVNATKLVIEEEGNSKNKFTFYCPVEDSFKPYNQNTAYFALGGELKEGHKLVFKGATSPNAKIKGTKTADRQLNRQIPLMTEILPFNTILGSDNGNKAPTNFKPRGALLGLCFINKCGQKLTIKEITLPKDNGLFFEGSFDMHQITDKKAKFVDEENKEFTYPVEEGELDVVIGNPDKANLPLFHLWGMPKGTELKLSVKMELADGKIVYNTLLITKSFEDGKAYRIPVTLRIQPNPLDYVAPYYVNKEKTDFVRNYDLPTTDVIDDMPLSGIGYFTNLQAVGLFNGSKHFLDGYILPTGNQWRSICPEEYGTVVFELPKSEDSLTEAAQVGQEPVQDYTGDYLAKKDAAGDKFCTSYALRFKGTKWESAWCYSYEGPKNKKKLVIKCVGGLRYSGLKLSDIDNPLFFDKTKHTKRIFPSYGFREIPSSITEIKNRGVYGRCWGADLSGNNSDGKLCQYYLGFRKHGLHVGHAPVSEYHIPVRPFYEKLP